MIGNFCGILSQAYIKTLLRKQNWKNVSQELQDGLLQFRPKSSFNTELEFLIKENNKIIMLLNNNSSTCTTKKWVNIWAPVSLWWTMPAGSILGTKAQDLFNQIMEKTLTLMIKNLEMSIQDGFDLIAMFDSFNWYSDINLCATSFGDILGLIASSYFVSSACRADYVDEILLLLFWWPQTVCKMVSIFGKKNR